MNNGKSYTFFSWAAINAWVPPIYRPSGVPPPIFSYSNSTSPPPSLATHDPFLAWENINSTSRPWVRPDYVVKVDDDSFIMLAELEARLRLELHATKPRGTDFHETNSTDTTSAISMLLPSPSHLQVAVESAYDDPLITNRLHQFMAGELYALSWSLVDWVSKDATVKTLIRGAEDKQTAKWMRLHPRASEIRWTSERCWIYDHPRSGTV
jgi:Galactosyltransferase